MASVLWDPNGIIYIDYPEKGKTINADYYIETEGLFHQDNAL